MFLVAFCACGVFSPPQRQPVLKTNIGLLVWNGEQRDFGSSWAQANRAGDIAEVQLSKDASFSGDTSIYFRAKGSKWMGFGWNWEAYAPNTGIDVRGYNYLVFQLKVEGDLAPDKGAISAQLASGGPGNQRSTTVNIGKYLDGSLADRQWHLVKMPLMLFLDPFENAVPIEFSLMSELSLGAWTESHLDFSMYVDDISFQ